MMLQVLVYRSLKGACNGAFLKMFRKHMDVSERNGTPQIIQH